MKFLNKVPLTSLLLVLILALCAPAQAASFDWLGDLTPGNSSDAVAAILRKTFGTGFYEEEQYYWDEDMGDADNGSTPFLYADDPITYLGYRAEPTLHFPDGGLGWATVNILGEDGYGSFVDADWVTDPAVAKRQLDAALDCFAALVSEHISLYGPPTGGQMLTMDADEQQPYSFDDVMRGTPPPETVYGYWTLPVDADGALDPAPVYAAMAAEGDVRLYALFGDSAEVSLHCASGMQAGDLFSIDIVLQYSYAAPYAVSFYSTIPQRPAQGPYGGAPVPAAATEEAPAQPVQASASGEFSSPGLAAEHLLWDIPAGTNDRDALDALEARGIAYYTQGRMGNAIYSEAGQELIMFGFPVSLDFYYHYETGELVYLSILGEKREDIQAGAMRTVLDEFGAMLDAVTAQYGPLTGGHMFSGEQYRPAPLTAEGELNAQAIQLALVTGGSADVTLYIDNISVSLHLTGKAPGPYSAWMEVRFGYHMREITDEEDHFLTLNLAARYSFDAPEGMTQSTTSTTPPAASVPAPAAVPPADPQKAAILAQGYSEAEYQAYLGYRTLSVGMRGDDVTRLKDRMYELGYFKNPATSNQFTSTTAEYVKEFLQANGYSGGDGSISPEQQLLFYSDKAVAKPKPITYNKFSYKDVARSPDAYIGQLWRITAYVVQQIDSPYSSDVELILNARRSGGQVIYAQVQDFKNWTWGGPGEQVTRLLQGDRVELYCEILGEHSYETVDGRWLTVPLVKVVEMKLYY